MAYLIKYAGMSYYKAKNWVEVRRREVSPNNGFLKQLQLYEKKLKEEKINSLSKSKEEKLNSLSKQEEVKIEANASSIKQRKFRCKICRRQLFEENNVIHENQNNVKCTSIFLDSAD
eukprot:TRINITY_DN18426_c0_g1_i1.p4 TRINITY_DN18426_c0_g1~~TRINITY_DN18426_c0_g1_i1.p4  ORF type:complete len:117 (-),score=28.00 TRINITY_DN18426_c0_g1_i1:231-581(-)